MKKKNEEEKWRQEHKTFSLKLFRKKQNKRWNTQLPIFIYIFSTLNARPTIKHSLKLDLKPWGRMEWTQQCFQFGFVPFLLQIRIIDLTTCTRTIFRSGYNLIFGFSFILFSSFLFIHRIFQTLNAFSNRQQFYFVITYFSPHQLKRMLAIKCSYHIRKECRYSIIFLSKQSGRVLAGRMKRSDF